MSAAKPVAQEVEAEAGQASIPPLVQGPPLLQESAREVEVHSISFDDTSRVKEVVDAEVAGTMERPAPTSGEGSSALMRVQPKPHGWDHPRVLWQSLDDPEGEPLFALEDVAEGGAGAPSSNIAGWRCGRCEQRCLSWTMICPMLPKYVSSFPMRRHLVLSFFAVHDPCSAYLGARGPVPWEVVVPPSGEGRLGPAPAAEGPARQCQRASIGTERGGGGPSSSLC